MWSDLLTISYRVMWTCELQNHMKHLNTLCLCHMQSVLKLEQAIYEIDTRP
jgi:hypothetical protein